MSAPPGEGAFLLDGRLVGPGAPTFVIGEVGLLHDGSLGLAHAFIDAIADAGADAVKFQTHIAEAESTAAEPFRVRFAPQDATWLDSWRRTGPVARRRNARGRGITFLSSPFSTGAIELLARVGVPGWKVGSGEVSNAPMLRRMGESGLPVPALEPHEPHARNGRGGLRPAGVRIASGSPPVHLALPVPSRADRTEHAMRVPGALRPTRRSR